MREDYILHTVQDEIVDDDCCDSTVLCDVDFNDLLANEFFRSRNIRDTFVDCNDTIYTLHFTIDAVDTNPDEIKEFIDEWVERNYVCTKACDEYIKVYEDEKTNSYLVIVECKPYEILNELNEDFVTVNGKVTRVKGHQASNRNNVIRYANSHNVRKNSHRHISKDDVKKELNKGIKRQELNVKRCTDRDKVRVKVKGSTQQNNYGTNSDKLEKAVFAIVEEIGKFEKEEIKKLMDKGLGERNNIDNLCELLSNEFNKSNRLFHFITPPNIPLKNDVDIVPFSAIYEIKYKNKKAYLYYRIVQAR